MPNEEELDYTPDLITLEDEKGVEHQCEVIDAADYNGEHYLAVVPYTADGRERSVRRAPGRAVRHRAVNAKTACPDRIVVPIFNPTNQ